MTNFSWCDIICKLSARAESEGPQRDREKALKKVEKTFKKGVDKPERMWYNNKVAAQSGDGMILEN